MTQGRIAALNKILAITVWTASLEIAEIVCDLVLQHQ